MNVEVAADNCGDCGIECVGGPNAAAASCQGGRCVLSCIAGWHDCDGDPENGCEVALDTDAENCGSCGQRCADLAQVEAATCSEFSCKILRCVEGWADCDGNPWNGCEADLSDVASCGSCITDCRDRPQVETVACSEGRCVLGCLPGWENCDGDPETGCEAFLDSNPQHCGACDEPCSEAQICRGGRCVDPEIANWPLPPDLPSEADYEVDAAAGIVRDRLTGLQWQQRPSAKRYAWSDRIGHCESLRLGGFDDWRIPSMIELLSIMHFGFHNPGILETIFPQAESNIFLTTSYYPSEGRFVGINFAGVTVVPVVGTNVYPIRCVRGGTIPAGARYTTTGETVEDHFTGLVWQRRLDPTATHTWSAAQETCKNLTLAGATDWRAPSVKELFSITSVGRHGPAIDTALFPVESETYPTLWTSRLFPNDGARAYAVDVSSMMATQQLGIETQLPVRCVRRVD